jgi:hypothetical protein
MNAQRNIKYADPDHRSQWAAGHQPGNGASKSHTVFGTMNSHALETDVFTVLKADLSAPGAVDTSWRQPNRIG